MLRGEVTYVKKTNPSHTVDIFQLLSASVFALMRYHGVTLRQAGLMSTKITMFAFLSQIAVLFSEHFIRTQQLGISSP